MFQRNNNSLDQVNTVIGKDSYFNGVFSLKGGLKVEGCYEGENLDVETLFVTVTGKIKSNIKAGTVIVEGIIIGNVEAKNRIMLMPTSKILGEVRTPELIIQNGSVLDGLCVVAPNTESNTRESILKHYNNKKTNETN